MENYSWQNEIQTMFKESLKNAGIYPDKYYLVFDDVDTTNRLYIRIMENTDTLYRHYFDNPLITFNHDGAGFSIYNPSLPIEICTISVPKETINCKKTLLRYIELGYEKYKYEMERNRNERLKPK